MAHRHSPSALRQLRTLFSSGAVGGLTDAQLLEQFAAGRADASGAGSAAEAAFAALVDRHGPMVWGVCSRTIGDRHEAEDAFQATFLILARQAGSVWVDDSLGRWLRRVAHRVAMRARAEALRRRRPPGLAPARTGPDSGREAELDELRTAVADALGRLPEKYRAPVELCHLRGLKHDEAARMLGWPVGTVKSRLDRAKGRLRAMLTRRGLAPAAVTAAVSRESRAAVSSDLVRHTVQSAVHASRGTGELSTSVMTLVRLATKARTASRVQIAASAIGLAVAGAGAYALRGTDRAGHGPSGVATRAGQPTARGTTVGDATTAPPTEGVGRDFAGLAVDLPPAPPGTRPGQATLPTAPESRRSETSVATPPAPKSAEVPRPEEDLGAAIIKELRNVER